MTKSDYQDVAVWYDLLLHDWEEASGDYLKLLSECIAGTETWPTGAVDVACGTGVVTAALAQIVADVIGVDRSQAMLDVAQARLAGVSNVKFRCQSWSDLNVTMPGPTIVTCLGNSLPHCLDNEELGRVLVHLQRISAGGPIIIDSRAVMRMTELPINRVRAVDATEHARVVIRDTWIQVSPTVYDMIFDLHMSTDDGPDTHLRRVLRYRSDLIEAVKLRLEPTGLELVMCEPFVDDGDPYDIVMLRSKGATA